MGASGEPIPRQVGGHRFLIGLLVGVILGWALASVRGEGPPQGVASPATATATATAATTVHPGPSEGPDASATTGQPGPSDAPSTAIDPPEQEPTNATVTRVVDGDTMDVSYRGSTLRVRLIGVDTPETVHPSEPVECYGKASSAFTGKMLAGKEVRLEFDVERTDRYGRTLAYVWVGSRLFNQVLVRRGFASVATYAPNVKYVDRFLAAERVAREEGAGLWGTCDLIEPSEAPTTPPGGSCDPSYVGACIPPYPPDLDCADVGATNFRVVGEDPHGFDGDGDGVGCEA